MTKLTFGYSSLSDRVSNIQPPHWHGTFEFLVVTQGGKCKPPQGSRHFEMTETGVAKSRNEVLLQTKGEYLVFADDDVVFTDGLDAVVKYLDDHSDVDLVLAKAIDESGHERKRYPSTSQKLNRFNSARAATYEMVVRAERVRSKGIIFDTSFGAGAANYLGDEYIFICDLLAAGLKAVYLPIVIAKHPKDSSGSGWGSEMDRTARSKVFTRVFGMFAPLVRALFGLRRLAELGGLQSYWKFIWGR
jgi:glycosyltransferase involved in cell wall biosynthesis